LQKGSIELVREQGLEQGRKEGEERGERGERKTKRKIAISLLELLDDQTIAEKIGLSAREVKELR